MPIKTIARGKYELIREIGAGGMGTVYEGRDTQFGETVAIKLMKVDPNQNFNDTVASFMGEARTYRQLGHPNIVRYLDFVQEKAGRGKPDDLYLVTEYINGKSLEQIINDMRAMGIFFDENRAKTIIIKLLDALKYSHAEGVYHRDIKPSNVMFDESNDPQTMRPRIDEPRLIDFGIAKRGGAGSKTIGLAAIAFSPHYASPEQATGADLTTASSDIYSVGVLLYDMLTGNVHQDFPSRPGVRMLPGADDVPVKVMNAQISSQMKTIILKATDPFSAGRYKTDEEMIIALSSGPTHPSVPSSQPPPGKPFGNFTTTRRPEAGIKPKD